MTYEVGNIMTTDIISVTREAPLGEAVKRMVNCGIGSVVVTHHTEICGIVTERDVLKRCFEDTDCRNKPVDSIMSRPLITIEANAAIGQAADLMAEKKIRRLLVTEGDKIQGIVTERDLMRATIDVFKKLSGAWI